MGRKDPLVKDVLTGEMKPRSTLWKGENHRYYTSKEAYEKVKAEKERSEQEIAKHRAAVLAARQAKKEAAEKARAEKALADEEARKKRAEKKEKEAREATMLRTARETLYNIVGIPYTEAPPGRLLVKEKQIRDGYGLEAFYECVMRCQDEIREAIARMDGKFEDLEHAGLYAFGVVRRRMPDIALQLKREARAREELEKQETWVPTESELRISGAKQKSRDLTAL